MGGLGALNIAIRNPEIYKTVSAFVVLLLILQKEYGVKSNLKLI